MNLLKQKPLVEATKEALEKSIRNNLNTFYILQFIFFGLLTTYVIYYVRTGKYDIYLLVLSVIVAIFVAMYLIIYKIDRARLEIYKARYEE